MLTQTASGYTVDYNVHDVVGVRLVNAQRIDVAAVTRQLGPFRRHLNRSPDVTIRFVEQLSLDRTWNIEIYQTAFSDYDFYIFNDKQSVTARIAFDEIGQRSVIVSQTGMDHVPLLIPILHLTALKADYVALNASAFVYQDKGIVATGWSKGGKTEALLAFGLKGAPYVADQWTLLSGDGERMFGLPRNAGLWEWSLTDRSRDQPGRIRQFSFIRPLPRGKVRPAKFFLLIAGRSSEIVIEPSDPLEVAERMISATEYEQVPFMQKYLSFKYAFPGRRNQLIEDARDLQYDILRRALAGKEAYTVWHPYLVALPRLFDAMSVFAEA